MKNNTQRIFLLLFGMLIAAVGIGMNSGAVSVPFSEITRFPWHPILYVRFMRILAGIIAGSGLAVCGIVLQALLRNPLADPYLLGTSSGAGLAAVIALAFGVSSLALPWVSFIGAVLSIILVYGLARQQNRIVQQSLILSGVIISVALSALIVFLVTLSPQEAVHGMTWWLWGSLRMHDMRLLLIVGGIVAVGSLVMYAFARELNAISIGDEEAIHLGIPVESVKKILLLSAAFMTAAIVCICGIIGFVGLMIPHMMRFLVGPDHRRLIPAACLGASVFMILADVCARMVLAPLEIPIGVISALIGAPVFIVLMKRSQKV